MTSAQRQSVPSSRESTPGAERRDSTPGLDRHITVEEHRLIQDNKRELYWKRWGCYLSERQWATVREDYSINGDAWGYFPYEHANSRAFRWGEDGIAGVSDTHALQCVSFAFWNEKDDFLKERLFGLTGPEGNHGEDVKEEYFYLDNTPTHSYMDYNYKYPQSRFPYEELRRKNAELDRHQKEFELVDTGIFDENRYWDIFIETAKDAENPNELNFRVTAINRGPDPATLDIVPQIYFRNTWSWNDPDAGPKPSLGLWKEDQKVVETDHWKLGKYYASFEDSPELLFTENVSNKKKLWGADQENEEDYVKDAFHEYICDSNTAAVNPEKRGTKLGARYHHEDVPSGEVVVVRFRLTDRAPQPNAGLDPLDVDSKIEARADEADEFYYHICPMPLSDQLHNVHRQAFAGMLWNKQYYQFIWEPWALGDPGAAMPPPPERLNVRNKAWKHLHIDDILSMPDKWEYPFFAAWDSSFHCVPLAMIDPKFAKSQLDLMCREWYMHPNGQLPAYEWNFSDVNPPVHAWATYRVFKIERRLYGHEDLTFLERVFQKLLLNFTWWVNQKDFEGRNVFEGGFLGMDNIGLFNRSEALPTGGVLEQADGTGWMGFFCLQMLSIALELSKTRPVYEDIASKFFEHFLLIADAISYSGGDIVNEEDRGLWNEEDGFYYDKISWGGNHSKSLPVRSLVGLVPLFATMTISAETLSMFPKFTKRVEWFITHRPEIAARNLASLRIRGEQGRLLLSLANRDRLERILSRMLDEDEFLSDFGIRSMSKYHKDHPYTMEVHGETWVVDYEPAESLSGMFGGNSNWRGPIWFPTNFLLIESLQHFYLFYGKSFKIPLPTKGGDEVNLAKVAENLQHRLIKLFVRDKVEKRRPYNGKVDIFDYDPHYEEGIYFHEYFDPDTGRGLGSKHQCGWTGLVAKLIQDTGMSMEEPHAFKANPKEAATRFFDDESESRASHRGRHKPRRPAMSRSNSTFQRVANISDLLEKYSMSEDGIDETI